MARSIAFGLDRRGAVVTITNRHDERATTLAEEVGCRTINWTSRASLIVDVVVNCTPVGHCIPTLMTRRFRRRRSPALV